MTRLANALVAWFWSVVSSVALDLYLFADKQVLAELDRMEARKKKETP